VSQALFKSADTPLGLPSAVALVIASMIGAGLFTTSGFALAALGSAEWVLAAWGIGGVVSACGAIGYGALAQALRESGGEYVYLARRVHPLAGFLAGWISLLAGFTTALAFAATALEAYAAPLLGIENPAGRIAVAVILLATAQHAIRVDGGAWVQNLVVAVKVVGLVVLTLAGWWYLADRPPSPAAQPAATPDWYTFANQLTWVYVGYSGFNAAVYVAEEVRQPERTVPRAMLLATLLVAVLYLALNAVFVYAGPIEQLAGHQDIAARAMRLLGGPAAETACRVLICLALASSVSALTMSGPRVYAKMAADRLFPLPPPVPGRAPALAIVLQAALAILVALLTDLRQQLDYLGFVLMLCAAGAVATVLRGPAGNPRGPAWWQRAAAAVFVFSAVLFATLSACRAPVPSLVAGGATVVSGIAAYYALRRWYGRPGSS